MIASCQDKLSTPDTLHSSHHFLSTWGLVMLGKESRKTTTKNVLYAATVEPLYSGHHCILGPKLKFYHLHLILNEHETSMLSVQVLSKYTLALFK